MDNGRGPSAGSSPPLLGVRVLITRPARQAGDFAQAIAALGGVPVDVPAIEIFPLQDRAPIARAHAALATCAAAIFVSANAVEHGAPPPSAWPQGLAVFAPGPGTAKALAAAGAPAVHLPRSTFDSEGLLALPELRKVAGHRIAIFRGEGGRDLLIEALVARGAYVDCVSCYRRGVPPHAGAALAAAFAKPGVDAVTVTSSEGLANLWALGEPWVRQQWGARPTFAPHARIAAAARALGLTAIETPAGDEGLLAGLLEWFTAHPRPLGLS